MAAEHEHVHVHDAAAPLRSSQRSVLWIALAANAALLIVEAVAGFLFHSLALLADAVHLLTDVSGLALAALAMALVERPATTRHTFGLQRAEVLAAQANALILLGVSIWVISEAVRRLVHPQHVSGLGLVVVASAGLVVNLASARLLGRAGRQSLNMRGAFVHLASDALGSFAAIVAGGVILVWDSHRADPVASLLISLLVLWAGWRLLRDTMHVLLEGTPRDLDAPTVQRVLAEQPGVRDVHHLHLWNLASDVPALSAHVVLDGEPTMHDAQIRGERVKAMLAERFGIDHATLELECHGPEPAHPASAT